MLRRHVCVHDDRGQAHQFGPGDDVPAWARKQITNSRAWAEKPAAVPTAGDDAPVEQKAPARRSRTKTAADPDAGDGQ